MRILILFLVIITLPVRGQDNGFECIIDIPCMELKNPNQKFSIPLSGKYKGKVTMWAKIDTITGKVIKYKTAIASLQQKNDSSKKITLRSKEIQKHPFFIENEKRIKEFMDKFQLEFIQTADCNFNPFLVFPLNIE